MLNVTIDSDGKFTETVGGFIMAKEFLSRTGNKVPDSEIIEEIDMIKLIKLANRVKQSDNHFESQAKYKQ